MENGKVGVYICSGCGIGDALDVEQLANVATSEGKVPVCKTHAFLCGPEGAGIIKEDIAIFRQYQLRAHRLTQFLRLR